MKVKFSALSKGNRRSFVTPDDFSRDELGSRNKNLVAPSFLLEFPAYLWPVFGNQRTNTNPVEGSYGR
jgi:hypothetical protein